MKKLTILIDMDDVLEDLLPVWVAYLNEKYGCNVRPDDITGWTMADFFPDIPKPHVYDALLDEELWTHVRPKQGAQDYVHKMIDDGHQVFIVTASNYKTLAVKMEDILFKYFPYLTWDNVIITSRKQMIRGDVLIDDGVHNLIGGEYNAILMNAPHNRSFNEKTINAVRAMNWNDVYRFICNLSNKGVMYGSY